MELNKAKFINILKSLSISNFEKNKRLNNELYKETIISTRNSQNVEIYKNKLCEYLNKQKGDSNWTGYFPLAFPKGCCPGYDPEKNTCAETFGLGHDGDNHHTEQDHKDGKITDHTLEEHQADKSPAASQSHAASKSDKSKNDPSLKPVLFD